MSLKERLATPRHPLAFFLAVTIVPGIALGWLGWRVLREDQALEARRVQARLDTAAEGIAVALDRSLAQLEERLVALCAAPADWRVRAAGLANEIGEDALVAVIDRAGVEAFPGGRLLYYPSLPVRRQQDEQIFAAGEAMELQHRDPAGASTIFRQLARSPDPDIRAGALLRLARSLRKTDRPDEALAVYGEMSGLSTAAIRGIPADLLARQARCNLLDGMARGPEADREARALYSDLLNGRWMLPRTVYRFHSVEAQRRLKPGREVEAEQALEQERLALAEGVESLWDAWQRLRTGEGSPSGRQGLRLVGRFVSLVWRGQPDRMTAVVAGPRFVAGSLLGQVRPLALRQRVRVTLADAEGDAIGDAAQTAGRRQVMRSSAETHLPWTLLVSSLDPMADVAEIAGRRRILVAAFAVMIAVTLAGSCFLARAVTRELEAARLKTDFVAAVSHEFRTPLASMSHIAELFADDRVPDEGQRRQYCGLLMTESRRLNRLVEDLLDFARIEGGAREYRLAALDAGALVEDTVREFQEEVAPRGYRIDLSVEVTGMILQADREALRRALWNLLDNAVKYSPDSRTVRVQVDREDRQCRILVRDQGLGIPARELKQIFEKFARGASARVAGVEGTGIGLSIADRIVRAHGGWIRVESEPGRGSTFAILVPVED